MPKILKEDINTEFLRLVGENIKKKRQQKKLTLEQLGLEVGLTRMQINRIENGYNITLTTILKLALALEIKPETLIKVKYSAKKGDLEKLIDNSKPYKSKRS